MGTGNLTIGMLARATGTKVETVRFYERNGLLPVPARTDGNYRSYEPMHLERLSFIRRARDLGFSLDRIRQLLALSDDREQSCNAVDVLVRQHLVEVQAKIDDLRAMQCELDRLLGQCQRRSVADCRIIKTLSPKPERPT